MTISGQRIFVSHSHRDNDFGTKLAQDLRRALTEDSAVFYDVMGGLHGGDRWWEKILKELTARDVFLLILSPDAMKSRWVRREIDIALNKNKDILPVLHRSCDIRADLEILQIISFLAPNRYEQAFQEILVALHLPVDTLIEPKKPTSQPNDPAMRLIHHIETAFTEHDWPDVIRKAEYLIKHMPASSTSLVYRWQAVALVEEGEEQQAQEAFQTALALVSDRQQRLTLLSDYTALLVRQKQWTEVLQRAREALRLVPHDPAWLAMQQQAQDQLAPRVPPTLPSKQAQIKDKEPVSIPPKTSDQWFVEGNTLNELKRSEEALRARQAEQTTRNAATSPVMVMLARLGYAVKGILYIVIGILAALLGLGQGGKTTDQRGALGTIGALPFGKFLLVIITVGLFAFGLWSIIQALFDTEGEGKRAKGTIARIGYATVGISYIVLGFGALRLVTGSGSASQSTKSSTQDWTATLLKQSFGQALVVIVGFVVLGVAVYLFMKAYKAPFRAKLNLDGLHATSRKIIINSGRFGYAALGVVFTIIGIFLIVAAVQFNPGKATGLDAALKELLLQPFGPILLVIVALGLIAYGLYSFAEARYRRVGR